LGDSLNWATGWAARPEKTDRLCEEQLGFGTAKAVITSGAVMVHASTLLASSQGAGDRSVTNITAFSIFLLFRRAPIVV
jgi:hypothetical protein